jgi:Holliday junction DNA helicase RuvB
MSVDRIVSPKDDDLIKNFNQDNDNSLRPKDFKSYIGQEKLKRTLKVSIKAAKMRQEPLDHILLYGPPGLGKTSMANVIATEMNAQLKITSGPAIERIGDLASLLTKLEDGDILFIDEIHRLGRNIEESLYSAMEDFKIDIFFGKGPTAESMRFDLPKITIIGATTRTGALSAPLRDRFGILHRLEYYTVDEIQQIIHRSAAILHIVIEEKAAYELALRSRLTPRIANRLLKRVRDYADVKGLKSIDYDTAIGTLNLLEVDEMGLDQGDRLILRTIIESYNGGPIGLGALSAIMNEDNITIEDFYEPYLMQVGLIERTPRGRIVTNKAYRHLNIKKD